jgi:hypothetical protein
MPPTETLFAMIERHIAEGEEHVAKQRDILRRLYAQGHPTVMAETLLAEFESTLRDHVAHRDRILAERSAD